MCHVPSATKIIGPFLFYLYIIPQIHINVTLFWHHSLKTFTTSKGSALFFWRESMNNSMRSSGDRIISMGLWSPCSPDMNPRN